MGLKEWWARVKTWPVSDVIKHKHRFVVMDTDTFKEKFSFQLSGINLFVTIGITVIVLILLTTVLIAFTPLREWIPGYTDERMVEQTYANAKKIDSLEVAIADQEWLLATMQAVIRGDVVGTDYQATLADSAATIQQVAAVYRHSVEDSLLRLEVEREDNRYQVKESRPAASQPSAPEPAAAPQPSATSQYAANPPLAPAASQPAASQPAVVQSVPLVADVPSVTHLFLSPLKGKILTPYSVAQRHTGVDISGNHTMTVNATYGGTVVFAGFTTEAGYVIMVQHPGNVVSVYSNNSSLLKRQGDVVRVGEPIAYVGTSSLHPGLGPHLHFELWVNGAPVNPEEYISF